MHGDKSRVLHFRIADATDTKLTQHPPREKHSNNDKLSQP